MVQLKKIFHRNEYQIGIYFGYDDDLKAKVRTIGATWSQTHRCWYVLYNKENYNLILRTFDEVVISKEEDSRSQPEPAGIQHEIVHIAASNGEFLPQTTTEHKGVTPDFADRIALKPTTGKYWVLQIPYKEGIPQKLKEIKGVYWNKSHKAYFVLRHVNVKLKVEALLGVGEIFPSDYYNLEQEISNRLTHIELSEYKPDNRWFMLGFPPVPFLIEQVRRWEGSRFSRSENAYLLNATPTMLGNLEKLASELNIPVHNNLPKGYLKKSKALNRKATEFKKLKEQLLLQVPEKVRTYTLVMLDYLMGMNYSPNTVRNYTSAFNTFLRVNEYQCPDSLTEKQIVKHLAGMIEQGLSVSSLNMLINALQFYFRMVLKRESFEIKIPRPRGEHALPLVLNMEEISRIFQQVENPKHKLLLLLGYGAGLRRSEIISLKWADVQFDDYKIHVKNSKGNKDRMVMLPYSIVEYLKSYRAVNCNDEWVFPGQYKGESLSAGTVQTVMGDAVKRAGLEKKATVHTLRHSFATHLMEGGTDIRYIQALMGHSSIKTTMIYTHISPKAIRKVESPLDKMLGHKPIEPKALEG